MIGTVKEQPSNLPHGGLATNIVSPPFSILQSHFPQWAHVGRLDRNHYPKSIKPDRVSVPPSMVRRSATFLTKKKPSNPESQSLKENSENLNSAELSEILASNRVMILEKNIKFLKKSHLKMLTALHQEVEKLMNENKELQFELVMKGCLPNSCLEKDTSDEVTGIDNNSKKKSSLELDNPVDSQRISFLEEEIQELRQSLHDTRARNLYLANLLEKANKVNEEEPCCSKALNFSDLNHTSDPLMVYPKDEPGRPPTLQECKVIIKHLHDVNELQQIELTKLKASVMLCTQNHAYQPGGDSYSDRKVKHVKNIKLPKIHSKPLIKKEADIKSSTSKEKLTLPVLKPSSQLTKRRHSQPSVPDNQEKHDS